MWRNWKTSAPGLVGLLVGLSAIWLPPAWAAKVSASGIAIMGCGLLAAKDADK